MIDSYKWTFQERKILNDIDTDLKMWGYPNGIKSIISDIQDMDKKKLFNLIRDKYQSIKNEPIKYTSKIKVKPQKIEIREEKRDYLGFGSCPVASEKTRCCNLLTLDAVESCGFDCSYCSIQSFYHEGRITFDKDLQKKLDNIKLDPNEFYHIGTGQSSDSLMWGNRYGVLDALVDFARKNPNVLLEFKTKSDNISYFLEQKDLPKNLLFTWSVNPQIVIDNEEHLTASLEKRLKSARKIADIGMLVGFHFHPIIYIDDFEKHYGKLIVTLLNMFSPKEVVLISLGTLTFIKPVIKKIKKRRMTTQVLKIPMVDASGKLSYPLDIKRKMFKFVYDSFKPWHKEVYFYMCMEDKSLWKDVFGYEYPTNESFEMDMKLNYMKKVRSVCDI